MRRMRFLAFGVVSFVVAIVGTLLAPGTFVNRAFSAALCTLFSFNWTFCTVDLGKSSQRVVAANPPAVVADISNYLQAQRDPSEFGDEPSTPSPQPSNPQAPPFPQDPGPNYIRPEFDSIHRYAPNSNDSSKPDLNTNSNVLGETENISLPNFEARTLTFVTENGCQQAYEIKSVGGRPFVESATMNIPVNGVCSNGTSSFSVKNMPNGDGFVLAPGNNLPLVSVRISNNGNTWRASWTDQSGASRSQIIEFAEKQQNKYDLKGVGDDLNNLSCLLQHRQCEQREGCCKKIKESEEKKKQDHEQDKQKFNQILQNPTIKEVVVGAKTLVVAGIGTISLSSSKSANLLKLAIAIVEGSRPEAADAAMSLVPRQAFINAVALWGQLYLAGVAINFNNSYECFLEMGIIGGEPIELVKNSYGSGASGESAFNDAMRRNRLKGGLKCDGDWLTEAPGFSENSRGECRISERGRGTITQRGNSLRTQSRWSETSSRGGSREGTSVVKGNIEFFTDPSSRELGRVYMQDQGGVLPRTFQGVINSDGTVTGKVKACGLETDFKMEKLGLNRYKQ